MELPTVGEADSGRDFDGAWHRVPPPSAVSKRTADAGAGSEHLGQSQRGSFEPAAERRPGGAEQVPATAREFGAGPGRGLLGSTEDFRGRSQH